MLGKRGSEKGGGSDHDDVSKRGSDKRDETKKFLREPEGEGVSV